MNANLNLRGMKKENCFPPFRGKRRSSLKVAAVAAVKTEINN
jgi:hypothetical protein